MKDFNMLIGSTLNLFEHSNMVSSFEIDNEVKLGLYYIMKIYHLIFSINSYGSWEFIMLHKDKDDKGLTKEDIINKATFDDDEYLKLKSEYEKGILPTASTKNNEFKKEFGYTGKYGWLSPQGDFIESDWGCHLESAMKIVEENKWEDDFDDKRIHPINGRYSNAIDSNDIIDERDYLCAKGYVLIHSPGMDGYIVSNQKPLTKPQREFLYDYFTALGNTARANYYICEEDENEQTY